MTQHVKKYKKLGGNLLIITIGSFASKILSFLFIPLYTAELTTTEYGTADLISTTVSLLIPFCTLLIGEAALRFALDKNSNKVSIFQSSLTVILRGGLLVILVSPVLLLFEDIRSYYVILVMQLVVAVIYETLCFFARGVGAVKEYSTAGVICSSSIIVGNIIFLLFFKMGVVGYLITFVLADIVSISYLLSSKNIRRYISFDKKQYDIGLTKEMLKYSIPMVPNSISWWISNSSDKYILSFFWGLTYNGIYSISYKVPSILSIITSIFSSAWLLSAVDDFGTEESCKFYSDVYNKYISLSIMIISALVFWDTPISLVLFDEAYFDAWKYQPILLIGVALHALSGFLGSLYTSAKKTRMLFVSTMFGAITNILLNIFLIPPFAAYGAAIATAISYAVVFIIRAIGTRNIMKLSFDAVRCVFSIVAITIEIIALYYFSNSINILSCSMFIVIIVLNSKTIIDILKLVVDMVQNKQGK